MMKAKANKTSTRRLVIIQVAVMVWTLAIGVKLAWLQVHEHDWLLARAGRQQQFSVPLSPTRGLIYDCNGNELARSVKVNSLYASPAEITDPDMVADRLSRLLDVDRDALFKRLTSSLVLVAVKRKLTDEESAKVEALKLPGLRFVPEMKRFYVSGASAAHVLGFVDMDEKGVGGLELTYDKMICGQEGKLLLDVDALKKSYDHEIEESIPGANINLTIDIMIQHYAEEALAREVRSSHARGGTIVVIRPATGEILALANYPTFDPNNVAESNDIQRRNRAVETAFEPGSIFKIVTYSAALEEKIITPDSKIDCQGGQIRIANRIVHDHPYGVLTAAQALAKSSNVAAIKLGLRLGNERLARYIDKFGFGRRTGIELPAESRGLYKDVSEWGPTSIGSIPMGHEVGVTALQAVAAFAAIANGGIWVQPHLVSQVSSASGEILQQYKGESHRVVSEATANALKEMLEGVVVRGTGRRAQISGYRAAGKTGTAQKVDPKTGRYSNVAHIASFAGFAPADNPEIACIVSIDEPQGAHHGGDVAAPVFAQVVSDALHTLGVPPEDDPQAQVAMSDFQVYDAPHAIFDGHASEEKPSDKRPAIDIATNTTERADVSRLRNPVVVPDLTGKGLREAIALCASRGLDVEASGDGIITGQSPPPGTLVAEETTCHLRLSKRVAKNERPPGAKPASRPATKTAKGVTTRANY